MECTSDSEILLEQTVVASGVGGAGGIQVALHPLVIMNISDHWTRVRAQEGKAKQVIGALIGTQNGRELEIFNSFELVYSFDESSSIILKTDYYYKKEDQFKQVYPELEYLGWYTTGESPNASDLAVHRQMCIISENPIFLKFNPQALAPLPNKICDELPIRLYESIIDIVAESSEDASMESDKGNSSTRMLFVPLTYTITTEQAERIGVDHVARYSRTNAELEGSSVSNLAPHFSALQGSIQMLSQRICVVIKYLKDIKDNKIPADYEILREIHSLCDQLPIMWNNDQPGCGSFVEKQFSLDHYSQFNDVLLLTYLGVMTKGCDNMNQFITKFNMLFDRQSSGRRMKSSFFV